MTDATSTFIRSVLSFYRQVADKPSSEVAEELAGAIPARDANSVLLLAIAMIEAVRRPPLDIIDQPPKRRKSLK